VEAPVTPRSEPNCTDPGTERGAGRTLKAAETRPDERPVEEQPVDHLHSFRRSASAGELNSAIPRAGSGKPAAAIAAEERTEDSRGQGLRRSYADRISELRGYGEEDGIEVRAESHDDFWNFIDSNPGLTRGEIFLRTNGNMRAIWQDDNGTRVGLQFMGAGVIEFVIFKKTPAAPKTSRVIGRTSFEGLKRHIDAFELHSLLFA